MILDKTVINELLKMARNYDDIFIGKYISAKLANIVEQLLQRNEELEKENLQLKKDKGEY